MFFFVLVVAQQAKTNDQRIYLTVQESRVCVESPESAFPLERVLWRKYLRKSLSVHYVIDKYQISTVQCTSKYMVTTKKIMTRLITPIVIKRPNEVSAYASAQFAKCYLLKRSALRFCQQYENSFRFDIIINTHKKLLRATPPLWNRWRKRNQNQIICKANRAGRTDAAVAILTNAARTYIKW